MPLWKDGRTISICLTIKKNNGTIYVCACIQKYIFFRLALCDCKLIFTRLKYRIIISIILLSWLGLNNLEAQEENQEKKKQFFHISGLTLSDSTHAIPYVHIILKNKNLATASDIRGYYNFPVHINDTLIFSALGYKMKTMVVRDVYKPNNSLVNIVLHQDTIQLKELVITPWQGSYERFRKAVLAYEPPMTDMDRAYKNLAIMDMYTLLYNSPSTPTTAFKNTMQGYNSKLYWAGQIPPINITNPLAWAQFFKALKNGDFKRKK